MLWEIDIHPAKGQPDRAAERAEYCARVGFGECPTCGNGARVFDPG